MLMLKQKYPTINKKYILNRLEERLKDSTIYLKHLPDPNSFKDMDKATKRIIKAIENREKIAVIGDYDVDGVVSTTIMREFFEAIPYPIKWVIPNRFRDGYGVSLSLLDRVEDVDLIITVDNGISSVEAIERLNSKNIDVIITDHHIVPENLPNAYAIINQKQLDCSFPYDEVCGAQISWYLCASIRRALNLKIDMKRFLELVSLAIIADIMPLTGINRAMVFNGLKILNSSRSPFIVAYREISLKNSLKAEDIAFGLAPLINSAGRIDDAKISCDYLYSKTLEEARGYLKILNSFNQQRKELESQIAEEAIKKVDNSQKILVVYGENWNEGVIGIVASRVARKFRKPTIILNKKGDIYQGSGRSFGECNLFQAVEREKKLTVKFGGHSKAIGLSVHKEDLEKFISKLQVSAESVCPKDNYRDLSIFGELPLKDIDDELFYLIDKFEPFGHQNRKPKFISRSVLIESAKLLSDGKHIKYLLKDENGFQIEAVEFRVKKHFKANSRIDILYTVSEKIFNDKRDLQLIIEESEESELAS